MGYFNPLLELQAGKELLTLPQADRRRISKVMRALRQQANTEAEKSWASRKGPMAAYWRAVSTYARHFAHALDRIGTVPHVAEASVTSQQETPGAPMKLQDVFRAACARYGIEPSQEMFSLWNGGRDYQRNLLPEPQDNSPEVSAAALTVLRNIIEDGFLTETNMQRGRHALDLLSQGETTPANGTQPPL